MEENIPEGVISVLLSPYTISILPPVDLRNCRNAEEAKKVYTDSYNQAAIVAKFLGDEINWKLFFNFYLPTNLNLGDLESGLRQVE